MPARDGADRSDGASRGAMRRPSRTFGSAWALRSSGSSGWPSRRQKASRTASSTSFRGSSTASTRAPSSRSASTRLGEPRACMRSSCPRSPKPATSPRRSPTCSTEGTSSSSTRSCPEWRGALFRVRLARLRALERTAMPIGTDDGPAARAEAAARARLALGDRRHRARDRRRVPLHRRRGARRLAGVGRGARPLCRAASFSTDSRRAARATPRGPEAPGSRRALVRPSSR